MMSVSRSLLKSRGRLESLFDLAWVELGGALALVWKRMIIISCIQSSPHA